MASGCCESIIPKWAYNVCSKVSALFNNEYTILPELGFNNDAISAALGVSGKWSFIQELQLDHTHRTAVSIADVSQISTGHMNVIPGVIMAWLTEQTAKLYLGARENCQIKIMDIFPTANKALFMSRAMHNQKLLCYIKQSPLKTSKTVFQFVVCKIASDSERIEPVCSGEVSLDSYQKCEQKYRPGPELIENHFLNNGFIFNLKNQKTGQIIRSQQIYEDPKLLPHTAPWTFLDYVSICPDKTAIAKANFNQIYQGQQNSVPNCLIAEFLNQGAATLIRVLEQQTNMSVWLVENDLKFYNSTWPQKDICGYYKWVKKEPNNNIHTLYCVAATINPSGYANLIAGGYVTGKGKSKKEIIAT